MMPRLPFAPSQVGRTIRSLWPADPACQDAAFLLSTHCRIQTKSHVIHLACSDKPSLTTFRAIRGAFAEGFAAIGYGGETGGGNQSTGD